MTVGDGEQMLESPAGTVQFSLSEAPRVCQPAVTFAGASASEEVPDEIMTPATVDRPQEEPDTRFRSFEVQARGSASVDPSSENGANRAAAVYAVQQPLSSSMHALPGKLLHMVVAETCSTYGTPHITHEACEAIAGILRQYLVRLAQRTMRMTNCRGSQAADALDVLSTLSRTGVEAGALVDFCDLWERKTSFMQSVPKMPLPRDIKFVCGESPLASSPWLPPLPPQHTYASKARAQKRILSDAVSKQEQEASAQSSKRKMPHKSRPEDLVSSKQRTEYADMFNDLVAMELRGRTFSDMSWEERAVFKRAATTNYLENFQNHSARCLPIQSDQRSGAQQSEQIALPNMKLKYVEVDTTKLLDEILAAGQLAEGDVDSRRTGFEEPTSQDLVSPSHEGAALGASFLTMKHALSVATNMDGPGDGQDDLWAALNEPSQADGMNGDDAFDPEQFRKEQKCDEILEGFVGMEAEGGEEDEADAEAGAQNEGDSEQHEGDKDDEFLLLL